MENEAQPITNKLARVRLIRQELQNMRERNRTGWGVRSDVYQAVCFAVDVMSAALDDSPFPKVNHSSLTAPLEFDLSDSGQARMTERETENV